MPDTPHLLIPYAASHSPAGRAALEGLRLPNLERLLARLAPGETLADDPDDAHPLALPHERALARALGLDERPGHTPWAAQQLLASGGEPGTEAWAWITPCHWQVGMDSVTLGDPAALRLEEADAHALFAAMTPYFAEDGLALQFQSPERWLARGELLRDLPTASLDRVIGQNVKPWLPATREARPLQRLQSEMQMLLYTHPVNEARAARGLAAVNAFWLSGAGALPAGAAAPPPGTAPVVPEGLREAALREDWPAWAQAWQRIDDQECAQLLAALAQTGEARLTLASEHRARSFEAGQAGLLSRLSARLRRPSAAGVLALL